MRNDPTQIEFYTTESSTNTQMVQIKEKDQLYNDMKFLQMNFNKKTVID